MNFQNQNGDRDCFQTCFKNAMRYFNVSIPPALDSRLSIFDKGINNHSIWVKQLGMPGFDRSRLQLKMEWEKATRYYEKFKHIKCEEPEKWTKELFEIGIYLQFMEGSVENKETILKELTNSSIIICDIAIPNTTNPEKDSRHAILIVNKRNNKLSIHDPLASNRQVKESEVIAKV